MDESKVATVRSEGEAAGANSTVCRVSAGSWFITGTATAACGCECVQCDLGATARQCAVPPTQCKVGDCSTGHPIAKAD